MTDAQRHLFPLPSIVEVSLTPQQRQVLDWVAYHEGAAAARFPGRLSRQSLRHLIEKKLVKVIGQSPGRYMLSEIGRLARTRHNGRAAQTVAVPVYLEAE